MSLSTDSIWLRRTTKWAPWALVTLIGLWLVWPMPAGSMPMSRDHTVHLTRIWMVGQELASFRVRGWSSVWFFGTPVGELYPILGDLVVVGVRALSLAPLSWPAAYALGVSLVFVSQGWVMLRVGRSLGLGAVPGLAAALLLLTDAGAYREGGWIYAIEYGVWPQTLATTLCWLGFGELAFAAARDADLAARRRHVGIAGLALGGSLLAHPISLPCVALGAPLFTVCFGLRDRTSWRPILVQMLAAVALALAIAAWWLLPMWVHRAWMASYGWLWIPLSRMARWAAEGHWTQHMPSAVGAVVAAGLGLSALVGSRFARFVGAFALALWLFASADTMWSLRLDHISGGFAHMQWQRFLIAAKPGMFLAAGVALGMLVQWGQNLWGRSRTCTIAAAVLWSTAAAGTVWMGRSQHSVVAEHGVGQVQTERIPGDPEIEESYRDFLAWARQRWETRDGFFRLAFRADRNVHFFMDAPVFTGVPSYKLGFTPGDNFVHKPESGRPEVLDALRVKYFVDTAARAAARGERFGRIAVRERSLADSAAIAQLRGPGVLEILEERPDEGIVRVRVSEAGPETLLVFNIAGYPRWELRQNETQIPWHEVPAYGDGDSASIAERRAGKLRGGKAGGDDGTEPTLIAAAGGDGDFELRYVRWRWFDVIGAAMTLVGAALCGALLGGAATFEAWRHRATRALQPAVLATVALALVFLCSARWREGAWREGTQSVAWLDRGHGHEVHHMQAGFLKTDMLICPAIVVSGRHAKEASVVFVDVKLDEKLSGWVALDDDAAKLRRGGTRSIRIEVRPSGTGWRVLHEEQLLRRPGRRVLTVSTGTLAGRRADVRVTVSGEGKSPPPLGFDLELGRRREP